MEINMQEWKVHKFLSRLGEELETAAKINAAHKKIALFLDVKTVLASKEKTVRVKDGKKVILDISWPAKDDEHLRFVGGPYRGGVDFTLDQAQQFAEAAHEFVREY